MIFNYYCLAYQIFSKHNIKRCIPAFLLQFPRRENRILLQKFNVIANIVLSILVFQFFIFYSHFDGLQGILTNIYLYDNENIVVFNFMMNNHFSLFS